MSEEDKLNRFKIFLESIGYDFGNDDLWMEGTLGDHKFRDLPEICNKYVQYLYDKREI